MAVTSIILQLSLGHKTLGCGNNITLTWVCYVQVLRKVAVYLKLCPQFGIGPRCKVIRNVNSLHQLAHHQKSSTEVLPSLERSTNCMTGVQACLTSTRPIQCTPVRLSQCPRAAMRYFGEIPFRSEEFTFLTLYTVLGVRANARAINGGVVY